MVKITRRDKTAFSQMPEILTAQEVAIILNVTVKTLRRWAANGQIPAHKVGVKLWRFYKSDIMALNEIGEIPKKTKVRKIPA